MKRVHSWMAAALLVAGLGFMAPSAASAHPYCGIYWGSLPESQSTMTSASIVDVRAGQHTCFDRIVVDLDGDRAGYHVQYVSSVREDGSGNVVPLRGGAFLEVIALAPAHDADGDATYNPADKDELVDVTDYRTFRQAAFAGSFEGQTTIGLGVRARLPFRVFTLDGPGDQSRLVVDVAHRW